MRALAPAGDTGVALGRNGQGDVVVLGRDEWRAQQAAQAAQAGQPGQPGQLGQPGPALQAGASAAAVKPAQESRQALAAPSESAAVSVSAAPAGRAVNEAAIRGFVEQWRQAWMRGDFESYRALYAPDFRGAHATRAAWERQRAQRLSVRRIQLEVAGVVVQPRDAHVVVQFVQDYRSASHRDTGVKELVLGQEQPGAWRIIAESWKAGG